MAQSMVCSWVTDGSDGLHMWRRAENILNNQSWSTDMGCSYNFGIGQGAHNSSL